MAAAPYIERQRTWPPDARRGGWAKSSVSGMSVSRFSRVIQSLRAVLTKAVDSSVICARVGGERHQARGKLAVHAHAEL